MAIDIRKKYNISFILFMLLVFNINLIAGYNAKYEPPDGRIIHGLGQYFPTIYTDAENWQYVGEYQSGADKIPVIFSVYTAIDSLLDLLDTTDFEDIVTNHGYPYLLLIGLSLYDSSAVYYDFNIPVEKILSGALDSNIVKVARKIRNINAPVFLRPGYEFGSGNSGIHSDPDMNATEFKSIWYNIYNIFEQENVENVAWVWNTVNPQGFNYSDWYPGDEYVDWWGVNYFTTGQITRASGFINDAASHQKPVMICESNPIYDGGTTNPDNWNNWFVPYFNEIKETKHIKAFVYISDPWDRGPWNNWPDSRISSNADILAHYSQEMNDSTYIHMEEYQENPGIIVNIPNVKTNKSKTYFLHQNYPNPFNGNTRIHYYLTKPCSVRWRIFSIDGKIITKMNLNTQHAGNHHIDLNLTNCLKNDFASGVYYFQLITDEGRDTIRMLLLK